MEWRKRKRVSITVIKWLSKTRSRGATAGRVVKLRETEPAGSERVEVRRLNLAAVTADVGEAHVVTHDDDDAWFLGCDARSSRGNSRRQLSADKEPIESSPQASFGRKMIVREDNRRSEHREPGGYTCPHEKRRQ